MSEELELKNKNVDKEIWFTLQRLLSYNAEVMMAVALRGFGKSYACKTWIINDWFKRKKQFVWIRQTDEQLKAQKETFMADLIANEEFGEKTQFLQVFGNKLIYKEAKIDENGEEGFEYRVVGHFVFLNGSTNAKGMTLPEADNVVFDEFLNEENSYLPNEIRKFNSVITTVFRNRDNCRIFMIANALSSDNPYFQYFGIRIPTQGDIYKSVFKKDIDGNLLPKPLIVVCQFGGDSARYVESVKKSTAGKIAMLGEYAESSINNKFILDDNHGIVKRKDLKIKNKFFANIYYDGNQIGVYDGDNILHFGKPMVGQITFVYFKDRDWAAKNENCQIMSKRHSMMNLVFKSYVYGYCYFEDQHTKNVVIEMMNDANLS